MEDSIKYLRDHNDFQPLPPVKTYWYIHLTLITLVVLGVITNVSWVLYIIAVGYLFYSFVLQAEDTARISFLVSVVYCLLSIFVTTL